MPVSWVVCTKELTENFFNNTRAPGRRAGGRLDRWGRSVTDLLATLQELEHLGVGFVSLTEALDITT
jgi:hypothetical protein